MDEVHYLADRMRGAVWEEVIIHLPESVALVSLSATVSNAEEFGEWLRHRARRDHHDRRGAPPGAALPARDRRPADVRPVRRRGRHRPRRARRDHREPQGQPASWSAWPATTGPRGRIKDRRPARGGKRPYKGPGGTRGVWTPEPQPRSSSSSTAPGLLPAIVFIFSRVGCDAAVQQCLNANLRLTTPEERDEIFAFVEERCSNIPDEDLQVLGYHEFLDGLTRGIAAHHAGMLPTFKECVEELFLRGLCRVGVRDRDPGARHQHAGPLGGDREALEVERRDPRRHHAGGVHPADRPGRPSRHRRRGPRRRALAAGARPQGGGRPRLDPHLPAQVELPAVVQHGGQPGAPVRPRRAPASCSSRRSRSSRPTRPSSGSPGSCARARRRWRGTPRRPPATAATSWSTPACGTGSPTPRRTSPGRAGPTAARRSIDSLESLRPGDVIEVPGGRFAGMAVVIDPGTRADREGPRPYVLTADRHARRLSLVDFPTPVGSITRVKIPRNFNGRNPQSRRDLASTLRNRTHNLTPPPPRQAARPARGRTPGGGPTGSTSCATQLRAHPCHGCPDREDHARWAERYFKLDRDAKTLQAPHRAAHQHDRPAVRPGLRRAHGARLPRGRGRRRRSVTDRGRTLMRIYNEMDLLTAESLRAGLWDDLDASELAAVLSTLVYESRRPDDAAAPRLPGGPVKQVLAEMVSIWADLDALEREHHLDQLHEPDLGFAWAAYRWAEGDELDDVLARHRPRGRRLRPLGQAAARPRRPGRRRRRTRTLRNGRPRGGRPAAPRRGGVLLGQRVAAQLGRDRAQHRVVHRDLAARRDAVPGLGLAPRR